jgi:DNA mismatch endonuclease (patch repair protein)
MADVHSQETRSYNMSRIKAQHTKPEMLVRKFLFANGFRYRLHNTKMIGKPDLSFPKYRTVIFIHGCFWHGHDDCRYFVVPKTRTDWWINKISQNSKRDKHVVEQLSKEGWRIITIWECDLRKDKINITLPLLLNKLRNV